MKKPEFEVIRLSVGLFGTTSCPTFCNPDCSSVCDDCEFECVGHCPDDGGCPWN